MLRHLKRTYLKRIVRVQTRTHPRSHAKVRRAACEANSSGHGLRHLYVHFGAETPVRGLAVRPIRLASVRPDAGATSASSTSFTRTLLILSACIPFFGSSRAVVVVVAAVVMQLLPSTYSLCLFRAAPDCPSRLSTTTRRHCACVYGNAPPGRWKSWEMHVRANDTSAAPQRPYVRPA